MTMTDITLPEVRAHTQTARFFRDGNKNKVEIKFVGSKDTINQIVTPEHMATYKSEWDAFCDGRPPELRPGTPLTDLPTISAERAEDYKHRNVHNLEELAALNDGQCQAMGHGTLTDRKGARELVAARQMQLRNKLEREVHDKQSTVGSVQAEPNADIETLKTEMAELKALLLQALTPKKGGRPKKAKAAE